VESSPVKLPGRPRATAITAVTATAGTVTARKKLPARSSALGSPQREVCQRRFGGLAPPPPALPRQVPQGSGPGAEFVDDRSRTVRHRRLCRAPWVISTGLA
jgi:hypothetical protein